MNTFFLSSESVNLSASVCDKKHVIILIKISSVDIFFFTNITIHFNCQCALTILSEVKTQLIITLDYSKYSYLILQAFYNDF